MNNCCQAFQNVFEGMRLEDIQGLNEMLVEQFSDLGSWSTFYKCKKCGQSWMETYEQRGHGEIPIVKKVVF